MKTFRHFTGTILFAGCLFASFFAQSQYIQLGSKPYKIIENEIFILNDSSEKYNDREIVSGKYSKFYKPLVDKINEKESSNYWIRFNFTNQNDSNNEFYLGTDKFQYLTAYFKQKGKISGPFDSGMILKETERNIQNESYSFFEIVCNKGDTIEVFLKAKNAGIKEGFIRYRLPLILMDKKEYKRAYERPETLTYLFIGAALLLIFFISILLVLTKQDVYLFFLGFVGFNLLFLVGVDPHFGYKLFGNTQIGGYPILIIGNLAAIFQILFSQKLLDIKKNYPAINKVLNGVIVLYMIAAILVLSDRLIINHRETFIAVRQTISNLGFVIQYPTIIFYCSLMIRKRHVLSIFMLTSLFLYIASAYVSFMQFAEVLPRFLYGMTPIAISQIGYLLGTSIFALMIGLKINEERKLRIQQEQEKQQLLAKQNELLEKQVNERTIELQNSLANLRDTQAKLIQSEKLASLGELTAGIAHEIQNPLNFVNNFSEVSTELIDELKEGPLKKLPMSEKEYAEEILGDLTQNLLKIHHHGDRASNIVKGMLEHSRTNSGEKRPTNLNALADEYLKIAYHGLRAKDKSFNCELVTDFDPELIEVEVVPQEIGRVLLNLFNNAFYAVHVKAKAEAGLYQPTVSVVTRQLATTVEIRVSDNGIGIPDAIKTKIFQPFFTTKPTGEGTGLGLSLSYDIISKVHGGAIAVESHLRQGTIFTISLPLSN